MFASDPSPENNHFDDEKKEPFDFAASSGRAPLATDAILAPTDQLLITPDPALLRLLALSPPFVFNPAFHLRFAPSSVDPSCPVFPLALALDSAFPLSLAIIPDVVLAPPNDLVLVPDAPAAALPISEKEILKKIFGGGATWGYRAFCTTILTGYAVVRGIAVNNFNLVSCDDSTYFPCSVLNCTYNYNPTNSSYLNQYPLPTLNCSYYEHNFEENYDDLYNKKLTYGQESAMRAYNETNSKNESAIYSTAVDLTKVGMIIGGFLGFRKAASIGDSDSDDDENEIERKVVGTEAKEAKEAKVARTEERKHEPTQSEQASSVIELAEIPVKVAGDRKNEETTIPFITQRRGSISLFSREKTRLEIKIEAVPPTNKIPSLSSRSADKEIGGSSPTVIVAESPVISPDDCTSPVSSDDCISPVRSRRGL